MIRGIGRRRRTSRGGEGGRARGRIDGPRVRDLVGLLLGFVVGPGDLLFEEEGGLLDL